MDWFLYDIGLLHERVNMVNINYETIFLLGELVILIFKYCPSYDLSKTGTTRQHVFLTTALD